ncbi:amidohydrolase [Photobacterium profundum]|uniref:Amidohydrolase 3 domain-containing protein n=1 Tax=Photobacterium profundum 3TCK TaxID=314280 RepID=Q1ZAQ3_9GAMM|nr:amidohydrolase [Photobacterium profundum]EAS45439.1 hypothetical protein P3TCK_03661 [Photobacterium profundum 3TCK]PSV63380.1 amidohydrolase [Photobacterium profundum]
MYNPLNVRLRLNRLFIVFSILAIILITVSCDDRHQHADNISSADTIYLNGNILTMAIPETAEALAITDGRIIAVGNVETINFYRNANTTVIDLKGKTLLPGFIDAHSHFTTVLKINNWANISAPPVGIIENFIDLLAALLKHKEQHAIKKGEWIIAYGYDPTALEELYDITINELDPVFPDNPVMIMHVSNHGAVLNSLALEAFNINKQTPTPYGGIISRIKGTNEPSGLVMEAAFLPIYRIKSKLDEQALGSLFRAQMEYAKYGYTTIVDSSTLENEFELLQKAALNKQLFLDVISLPLFTDIKNILDKNSVEPAQYSDRLKLGGMKLIMDGSPQSKGAWFTQPYLTGNADPDNLDNTNSAWRSEPIMPYSKFKQYYQYSVEQGLPVYTSANGDAAIDTVIQVNYELKINHEQNHRHVVVNSQFMRSSHFDQFKKLGLIPSFFSNNAFFWGDAQVNNLGKERAFTSNPMQSALEQELRFTNHTNFSVTPLNPLFMVWTAVNRLSRGGTIIGTDERISPVQALKAITINAAYQFFEESEKGSLEAGKIADLVILDKNPLTVAAGEIDTIQVVETIKAGKTIYPQTPVDQLAPEQSE